MFQDQTSYDLESMVDRFGLESMLQRLADIASEKSAHVESNWQDPHLAECWDTAARVLHDTAEALPEIPGF